MNRFTTFPFMWNTISQLRMAWDFFQTRLNRKVEMQEKKQTVLFLSHESSAINQQTGCVSGSETLGFNSFLISENGLISMLWKTYREALLLFFSSSIAFFLISKCYTLGFLEALCDATILFMILKMRRLYYASITM